MKPNMRRKTKTNDFQSWVFYYIVSWLYIKRIVWKKNNVPVYTHMFLITQLCQTNTLCRVCYVRQIITDLCLPKGCASMWSLKVPCQISGCSYPDLQGNIERALFSHPRGWCGSSEKQQFGPCVPLQRHPCLAVVFAEHSHTQLEGKAAI